MLLYHVTLKFRLFDCLFLMPTTRKNGLWKVKNQRRQRKKRKPWKMNRATVLDLQEISKIFHLIYYRNKNQHGNASWWKCFSLLKRNIYKLAQELLVDGDGGRGEETNNYTTRRSHSRIVFMREILLPKCYL